MRLRRVVEYLLRRLRVQRIPLGIIFSINTFDHDCYNGRVEVEEVLIVSKNVVSSVSYVSVRVSSSC